MMATASPSKSPANTDPSCVDSNVGSVAGDLAEANFKLGICRIVATFNSRDVSGRRLASSGGRVAISDGLPHFVGSSHINGQ